jgi:hypothetical protein
MSTRRMLYYIVRILMWMQINKTDQNKAGVKIRENQIDAYLDLLTTELKDQRALDRESALKMFDHTGGDAHPPTRA